MEKSRTESFYNKSLERALQILISFNAERRSLVLSEIAEIVGFPKPTILRLCATLIQYGFLNFDRRTKRYSPGLKFFEIGGVVYASFSLTEAASAQMQDLQEVLHETVLLDVLQDNQILRINAREEASSPIRIRLEVGRRRPPHYGGPGMVLMAYLPEDDVERLLEKFPLVALTARTVTDERFFKERLKIVRSQGYAIEHGEVVDFLSNVAAPVRDYRGQVIAALSVPYVSKLKDKKAVELIITETVKTALAFSQSLGYVNNT